MGTLYLVRHGQASFGAADYDRLSALGHRQAVRLGEHWKERGMRFDAVITGTLRRHGQTWDGIAEGLGLSTREATPSMNRHCMIERFTAPTWSSVYGYRSMPSRRESPSCP